MEKEGKKSNVWVSKNKYLKVHEIFQGRFLHDFNHCLFVLNACFELNVKLGLQPVVNLALYDLERSPAGKEE